MDLQEELEDSKRQYESGKIDDNKYRELRATILNKWLSGLPHTVNRPKEMDLYEILQLESNATDAEIRSKYRKLALIHHPDKNGGIEIEEWGKLSKAYQILSDENSRHHYDNYGTINNLDKTSFNKYVGGDLWQPYIGNLEIGLWLFSWTDKESSSRLADRRERRRAIRLSSIARCLQNKLFLFPKKDNLSTEFKSFLKGLLQDAQKLSTEPNGKELLSCLGNIYISEAEAFLNKFSIASIVKSCSTSLINKALLITTAGFFFGYPGALCQATILSFGYIDVAASLISGYLAIKTQNNPSQEEFNKLIWRLSRPEISSIVHEACEEVLNNQSHSENERDHLANSLQLLGEVWLKSSKA